MLAWRHGGFSAHNEVSVAAEDVEGRKNLAGYMLRAPISIEKMTYDAATGTVIYRSRMHAGLKRSGVREIVAAIADHPGRVAKVPRQLTRRNQRGECHGSGPPWRDCASPGVPSS